VKNRSALAILFIIVFVDLLGFGMVIPVMALYARELGASEAATGFLSTGYSAMQFIFAPLWGRLSDRMGRRPALLVSIAMTSVAFLVYGLAGSFAMLLASRLFAGIATANIGCLLHLETGASRPVSHWIELLDQRLAASA